jgi:hypothetical protein
MSQMVSKMNKAQEQHLKLIVKEQILQEGLFQNITDAVKQKVVSYAKQLLQKVGEVKAFADNPEMKEVGAIIRKNGGIKLPPEAQEIITLGQQFTKEANTASQTVQEMTLVQKHKLITGLNEISLKQQNKLNESVGVVGVVGIALSVISLLSWIGKIIEWIGNVKWLNWTTAAKFGHAMHHMFHDVEEVIHDAVIPDKLSYAIYNYFWDKDSGKTLLKILGSKDKDVQKDLESGIKLSNQEWITVGDSPLKKAINGMIFKIGLVTLLVPSILGALHSLGTIIGAIEAGASAVKGIEVAQGARAAATIASKV